MSRKDIIDALIREQGTLFSEEMGANIDRDEPVQWFHWLLGTILLSARISAGNAVQAAAALKREKLHKVDSILDSRREDRIKVLNENGYARFDNIGADQIHDAARLVKDRYHGDLRRLREEGGDEAGIVKRLKEVKGIGDTGAGIFCREAQIAWPELYPHADRICLDEAKELGLPDDPQALADLAGSRERFVRLVSALTRAALDGPAEAVEQAG